MDNVNKLIDILKNNEGTVLSSKMLCEKLEIHDTSLTVYINKARKKCGNIYTCHGAGYIYNENGNPYKI